MIKNLVIAGLVLVVVVLSSRLSALENYRYASATGMCQQFRADDPMQNHERQKCLHATKTRTNPLWNLLYGVIGE